jgi:hypothetical protein
MQAAVWMHGAYPPSEPMPAKLRKIEFISEDAPEPDAR